MKNLKSVLLAFTLVTLLASCGGGYYVSSRPAPYIYTRPVAPYNGAIWIEPEYYWNSGRYAARPGYWSRPRLNYSYHPGHWNHGPRGHSWARGGWRHSR